MNPIIGILVNGETLQQIKSKFLFSFRLISGILERQALTTNLGGGQVNHLLKTTHYKKLYEINRDLEGTNSAYLKLRSQALAALSKFRGE